MKNKFELLTGKHLPKNLDNVNNRLFREAFFQTTAARFDANLLTTHPIGKCNQNIASKKADLLCLFD
jgi:hypothetical protein